MNPSIARLDFTTFVLSVSSAAFYSLTGEAKVPVDLVMARQNIDLLEMLSEKTRGNLTEDEKALLEKLLFEVRLKFVEVQSARGGSRGES
ncbi:MAG: DUF1844 domain-containing protein [Oligoflexia bacterium]